MMRGGAPLNSISKLYVMRLKKLIASDLVLFSAGKLDASNIMHCSAGDVYVRTIQVMIRTNATDELGKLM